MNVTCNTVIFATTETILYDLRTPQYSHTDALTDVCQITFT